MQYEPLDLSLSPASKKRIRNHSSSHDRRVQLLSNQSFRSTPLHQLNSSNLINTTPYASRFASAFTSSSLPPCPPFIFNSDVLNLFHLSAKVAAVAAAASAAQQHAVTAATVTQLNTQTSNQIREQEEDEDDDELEREEHRSPQSHRRHSRDVEKQDEEDDDHRQLESILPVAKKRDRTMLPCSFCGKSFDRPSLLKRHLRTHTGQLVSFFSLFVPNKIVIYCRRKTTRL